MNNNKHNLWIDEDKLLRRNKKEKDKQKKDCMKKKMFLQLQYRM